MELLNQISKKEIERVITIESVTIRSVYLIVWKQKDIDVFL